MDTVLVNSSKESTFSYNNTPELPTTNQQNKPMVVLVLLLLISKGNREQAGGRGQGEITPNHQLPIPNLVSK
jgi:hypothetical protein